MNSINFISSTLIFLVLSFFSVTLAAQATPLDELGEGHWKILSGVTFKGKLNQSKPLNGQVLNGKIKYDKDQNIKITATGSIIKKDGTIIKSFKNVPVLLKQERYDFFQFDIDHWRVLLHTEIKGTTAENVVRVFTNK